MTPLIYGSVCSGIEAASVAWHPLGWSAAFLSEIEPFPRAVLAHHYQSVPLHGDFTTIQKDDYAAIDLLVGGTPCQSFSVAGLRKGLDDPRGNLMLEFGALAKRLVPRWIVWENVPGVLSSNGGRDFGTFLGMLGELGYGFAYRVLDAQFFGVAQRRRRVFVVGYLGDWRRAAAVLFERESMFGNPAPSREKGEAVATAASRGLDVSCTGTLTAGFGKIGAPEIDAYTATPWPANVAATLNAAFGEKQGLEDQHINQGAPWFVPVAHSLRGEGFDASEDGTGRGTPLVPVAFPANLSFAAAVTENLSPSMGAKNPTAVAYAFQPRIARNGRGDMGDVVGALNAQSGETGKGDAAPCVAIGFTDTRGERRGSGIQVNGGIANTMHCAKGPSEQQIVATAMQVRRLTPRECERLQGFPDGWTDVPYRGKSAADGPRYKALGNSMAVPVMRWIGERIAMVEAL